LFSQQILLEYCSGSHKIANIIMLPLKTILYLSFLFGATIGSLRYHPLIGLMGYIVTYNINPAGYWWGTIPLSWGLRYSLLIGIATFAGVIIHNFKLRFDKLFETQEILLIIYLLIIWLSLLLGLGVNDGMSYATKMSKVTFILLLASHIITDLNKYRILMWTLIITGLYLGYEMYIAPSSLFFGGRFGGGIGGSDFAEGNFLGVHFAMLLPFIGVMFMRGDWKSKLICLISGAFIINSIILTRSRGVFLAIVAGVVAAIIFSVPGKRLKIYICLFIGLLGMFSLTNPAFWTRMQTIEVEESLMDDSSYGRIKAWKAAFSMANDYPLGIGAGNFFKYVGNYYPEIPGKDTHNTLFRCLSELGIQGASVLLLLIWNAFRILAEIRKNIDHLPNKEEFIWHVYAMRIALTIYILAGLTLTHTYIEEFYWLLMFPVFLKRSVENERKISQDIKVSNETA
jgi:hypothetical protein